MHTHHPSIILTEFYLNDIVCRGVCWSISPTGRNEGWGYILDTHYSEPPIHLNVHISTRFDCYHWTGVILIPSSCTYCMSQESSALPTSRCRRPWLSQAGLGLGQSVPSNQPSNSWMSWKIFPQWENKWLCTFTERKLNVSHYIKI